MRNGFAGVDGIAKMVSSSEGYVNKPNAPTSFIALEVRIVCSG